MVIEGMGDGSPSRVPPIALKAEATSPGASSVPADRAVAAGAGEEAPHTPQVSSKHWRKIRSAVVALAAFRSRRVSERVTAWWRASCLFFVFVWLFSCIFWRLFAFNSQPLFFFYRLHALSQQDTPSRAAILVVRKDRDLDYLYISVRLCYICEDTQSAAKDVHTGRLAGAILVAKLSYVRTRPSSTHVRATVAHSQKCSAQQPHQQCTSRSGDCG